MEAVLGRVFRVRRCHVILSHCLRQRLAPDGSAMQTVGQVRGAKSMEPDLVNTEAPSLRYRHEDQLHVSRVLEDKGLRDVFKLKAGEGAA